MKKLLCLILILFQVQFALADDYTITEGAGRTMAADDISSKLYPRVKLVYGADGTNSGDASPTNPFPVTDIPTAATGWTPYKLISANTTNATSVKGSAGALGGYIVSNTNASPRWLKFYNKASAPTVGTDATYLAPIMIPGNSNGILGHVEFNKGIAFTTGIAFAITTGVTDADTGAVGANEVTVTVLYK